jgi:hypothetical protein
MHCSFYLSLSPSSFIFLFRFTKFVDGDDVYLKHSDFLLGDDASYVFLGDDDSFLRAGSIPTLEQRGPQVGLDQVLGDKEDIGRTDEKGIKQPILFLFYSI